MKSLEEKRKMDIENGKKGGRPKKRAKCAETPATKGRKPNETQERREEEKIGITPVVNNSSNTPAGGAADAATVVTGIPETAATGNSGAAESSGSFRIVLDQYRCCTLVDFRCPPQIKHRYCTADRHR